MSENENENELEPKIETETPSVEELLAENKRLKEHNAKVLGEKKSIKSELDNELSAKEQRKKQELEAKEDFKTMLEEANKKVELLESKLSKKQEDSLSKSIALSVQKLAGDAIDITDIIDKINITEDNIDTENETVTDLSAQIDEIRKSKPYLFDSKKPSMTTKLPNMGSVKSGGDADKKALKTRIAEKLLS